MKSYTVKIQKSAQKAIDKLDSPIKKRIIDWLNNNIEGCDNPRKFGSALQGNLSGKWRYRVGKYRIVTEINDDEVIVLVVDIGKRNDIYKK